MNERVKKITSRVTEFWSSQDKRHKNIYIALAASIIVIIIAAIIIAAALNKKEYIVLYENLETAEASQMVSLIEGMGYEARLAGGTISVVSGTENRIAMELAMQNYPKSGKNYEKSTADSGLFSTNAQERLNAKIDLENRLEAQISSMETIAAADVNLAIPEHINTVVSSIRQYPTAGVKVQLDGIEKLSNKQIIGIKNLVKTSVVGLTDDNVEIVDNFGIPQLINADGDYDLVLQETKKLAFKTNLEESIREKILAMLVKAYGEDGVEVAVNTVLNFDKRAEELVDYRPEDQRGTGVLQHSEGSDAAGGTTADGGVVGVEANADDTYPVGNTNGNGAWNENSFVNTYLVDTYKEQITGEGYRMDGISIAVMIYTDYLDEPTRQELVRLVGNSGTVDPTVVEDVVTVMNLPKVGDLDTDEPGEPAIFLGFTFSELVVIGVILLILLIVLFVVLAIISGNAKKKRKAFEKQIIETSGLIGMDSSEPVDMFVLSDPDTGIEVPSLTDDQIETKEVVIRREISEFASHSPEIVAQLLKTWIKNEED